jgi:hypothetical protein
MDRREAILLGMGTLAGWAGLAVGGELLDLLRPAIEKIGPKGATKKRHGHRKAPKYRKTAPRRIS